MKIKALLLLAVLACVSGIQAAETLVGGPKGGRLLDTSPHKAEFFVTPTGSAEIIFYDSSLQPAAVGAQVVAITAEPPAGRKKMELEKTANGFVSKEPLPASPEPYRIVVQVRESPGAPAKNFRIELNLENCGECQRAEYACTCGH